MTDSTSRRLRCRQCSSLTRLRVAGTVEAWQCANCGWHNAAPGKPMQEIDVENGDDTRTGARAANYGFE